MTLEGKSVRLDPEKMEFRFLDGNKLYLGTEILWTETGEKQPIAFTSTPKIGPDRQKIVLDNVEYTEGTELSPEITAALLEEAHQLLDLSNFELMPGMELFLEEIQIDRGKMTLQCETKVQQFST